MFFKIFLTFKDFSVAATYFYEIFFFFNVLCVLTLSKRVHSSPRREGNTYIISFYIWQMFLKARPVKPAIF